MRPWKKNNLTQGVKNYFHEIYFVKNIFENIVLDEKNITII